MIRKKEEMSADLRTEMRGGKGTIENLLLVDAPEQLHGKGRLFAKMTLPPGASIGDHPHLDEVETYYILSGQGEYTDGGSRVALGPGDLAQTEVGGSHAIANTGNEPLVLIALILNA